MMEEPKAPHRWLERFLGTWDFEADCGMGPDQPPSKSGGVEVVRPLGGFWIVAEGEGEMPGGGPAKSILTIGYDPRGERYVGTFVASMMAHLWVYSGSLDASGRVLTLEAEGPDFSGAKLATYKDVIEFVDDDHRVMTSHALGDDGSWHQFMTAHYRRRA